MRRTTLAAALFALVFAGCGNMLEEDTDPSSGENAPREIPGVAGQKADNYVSTNAREFELLGTARADLPDDFGELEEDERTKAIEEAVDSRLATVTEALKDRVSSRIDEAGSDSEDGDDYFMYARDDNEKSLERNVVDDSYVEVDFEWELVGSKELVKVIVEDGTSPPSFDVDVPGSDDGDTVTRTIEVAPSPSDDAFPKYDELFADGVYDIGLHIGGDYNDERYDIEIAKWTVDRLLSDGWKNPEVDGYDDLAIDSPPFTKTITLEGREIEAKVYLYHPEMAEDDQSKLSEKMRESFAERDVVLYNGHAGPGAGFILDYHPRHEIEPSEFESLEMADKYQIVVVNGCETYDSYVPDLMANPARTFDNTDILTTVNKTPISSGYQVTYEFLYWLTMTDDSGRHFPMTWRTILQGINKDNRRDAHYGIHGIDQDPELNPHASDGIACRPCDGQSQCGAGGNYCLKMDSGSSACGVACATDEACGAGADCLPMTEDSDKFYIPNNCVPTGRQCGG